MKKLLALVLSLVMMMGLATVGTNAAVSDFKDYDDINEEYEEAIAVMNAVGVFEGDAGTNTFRPNDTMKRSEVAKVVSYLLTGKKTADDQVGTGHKYTDLPASHWAAGYIELLTSLKVMAGVGNNMVNPDGEMRTIDYAKMLLVALGFDAQKENLVGPDYQIYTNALANKVGLFKGNDDLNITAPVTRQEAALYAFNTVKSPLVQYSNKGGSINVNGAEINFGGSEWEYMTTADNNARYRNIYDHYVNDNRQAQIIEFGEERYPGLKLSNTTSVYGQPCNKWTYNNVEIGKYVQFEYLVARTIQPFNGKDMFELFGETAIKSSKVTQYWDCKDITGKDIKNSNMIKTNEENYIYPDYGALTEIYQINDTNPAQIIFVTIDTFFAQAQNNYNSKDDSIRVKVFCLADASYNNVEWGESQIAPDGGVVVTVKGEDCPYVKELKKDDYLMVTADLTKGNNKPSVVEAMAPKTVNQGVAMKEFSKSFVLHWCITTEGEELYWNRAVNLTDTALIDENGQLVYNNKALDVKYTVYLDNYGLVIGLRPEETKKEYLFLAGFDTPASNIAYSDVTANVIFLDGTMKTIKVNVEKTDKNIDGTDYTKLVDCNTDLKKAQYNKWFTYTVKDGVYTLKPVQYWGVMAAPATKADAKDNVINTAKVAVRNHENKPAYGNDNSVYIMAKAGAVDTENAIKKVTTTYTGAQSCSIELYNKATDRVEGKLGLPANGTPLTEGVFYCFDKDGYIIGAICLGVDKGSNRNFVFITGSVSREYKDGEYYYWDFKAIVNGEEKTLTLKDEDYEAGSAILETAGRLQSFMSYYFGYSSLAYALFDKDGYVTELQLVDGESYDGIYNSSRWYQGDAGKVYTAANWYEADVNGDKDSNTLKDFVAVDIAPTLDLNLFCATLYAKGSTLYAYAYNWQNAGMGGSVGITVKKGAPVYMQTTTYGNRTSWKSVDQYSTIEDALSAMTDFLPDVAGLQGLVEIAAGLDTNGVAQWIIIRDPVGNEIETEDSSDATASGEGIYLNLGDSSITISAATNGAVNASQQIAPGQFFAWGLTKDKSYSWNIFENNGNGYQTVANGNVTINNELNGIGYLYGTLEDLMGTAPTKGNSYYMTIGSLKSNYSKCGSTAAGVDDSGSDTPSSGATGKALWYMYGTASASVSGLTDGAMNAQDPADPGDILIWNCNKASGTIKCFENGAQAVSRSINLQQVTGDSTYCFWNYGYAVLGRSMTQGAEYYFTFEGLKSNTGTCSAAAAAMSGQQANGVKVAD